MIFMVTHHWLDTQPLTKGITKYYPILRIFSITLSVIILRNPFDATLGLYIVGEDEMVEVARRQIITIIKKVEDRNNLKKIKKSVKEHGSTQKDKYRRQFLNYTLKLLEKGFRQLREEVGEEFDKFVMEKENLNKEYINNCFLKSLKPLKCPKIN